MIPEKFPVAFHLLIGILLQKLLLGHNPLITPFIGVIRIAAAETVFEHIGAAHIEAPAHDFQNCFDGVIDIIRII